MEWTPDALAERIRARGLSPTVERIALDGGGKVHPALEYLMEDVDLGPDSPAREIIRNHSRDDLVPLWQSGTNVIFSTDDGGLLLWNAEVDEPWDQWPDFVGAVRYVLTDLWEDERADEELVEVAALLLSDEADRAAALELEQR